MHTLLKAIEANMSSGKDDADVSTPPFRRLRTVQMSEVEAQDVQWLWKPYIPMSAFTILEGEEGLGKTWLLCAVAGAISNGSGLPSIDRSEPANVLLMSAEDSLSFVIKPRLLAVSAPCERIYAIDEHFTFDRSGIERLGLEIAEFAPKLVVIDPLFAYAGKINLNSDNEIRTVTGELTRLAEKYGCAIIGVRHIGKSKGLGDPRNAGLNGIGWRASARSVLLVGKDPNDDSSRAMVQTKNNLSPKSEKAIGYEITPDGFFWKESNLTAHTMLSLAKSDDDRTEHNEAVQFLKQVLLEGRQKAADVNSEARRFGISESRLRTARSKLGINPTNEGFGKNKVWYWQLPDLGVTDTRLDGETPSNSHLSASSSNKTCYANNLALDARFKEESHLNDVQTHLSDKCDDCNKDLDRTAGGSRFCPVCLRSYRQR